MTWVQTLNKLTPFCERFFFAPARDLPLVVFRWTVAGILLIEALLLGNNAFDFFGKNIEGSWNFGRITGAVDYPRLQTLFQLFHVSSTGQEFWIAIMGVIYILCLGVLLTGWKQRIFAPICLLLNFFFINSSFLMSYGIDMYERWGLFYLIFAPRDPRRIRLLIRVAQIHLAISYALNAYSKIISPDWWSGDILYGVLNGPHPHFFDFSWMGHHQRVAQTMSFIVLFLEAGFPVFIWLKKIRPYWVSGMILFHLMISLFLGLGLFGILLAAMNLSLFGFSLDSKPLKV